MTQAAGTIPQPLLRGPIFAAGILLGAGLGGFVDGIALHQILQWHSMLSSLRPPTDLVALKANMVWDGLFHALTWITTCLGLWRLWAAGRHPGASWSGWVLWGAILAGWGLFNASEGLIDHQILGLHHVHPGRHQLAWDLGFVVFGVALVVAGLALARWAPSSMARLPPEGLAAPPI
jgi:uncharacterized membrane protein